ncbi:MAG: hypothetical protein KDA96_22375 [Planctomycetaceae bacterium]|nr:hypothetical protein [Planctomycetaceae bacterium]
MKRIFLTLALLTNLGLACALTFGLYIGNEGSASKLAEVQLRVHYHMLAGLGALTFATLLHAILFTYFMGTGRWLEETSKAYSLPDDYYKQNQKIKYRLLPGLTMAVLMMVATGGFGAAADAATVVSLDGVMGMKGDQIHMLVAIFTAIVNILVNFSEYIAVRRNHSIIEAVLADVRRIREERGLPVE